MITPNELGENEDLARRVLARARVIAPCIDSFPDQSEQKKTAIAILRGVLAELPEPGSSRMRSLSRNGTQVSYSDITSAFSEDDIVSLRAMCAGAMSSGMPRGSFPIDRRFERLWPDEVYP